MTQHSSTELIASVVYRLLARAALVVAIAVIGLFATTAAPLLVPPLSTVTESTLLPLPAAAVAPQGGDPDRADRTNDDHYLDGLIKALDHDS
jgi:hypothetical protein